MKSDKTNYSDLIPDYHHGLLDPETLALFERELKDNTELQQELEEFKQFQELYQKLEIETPEPSEDVFRKINTSIDTLEKKKQPKFQTIQHTPSITTRLLEAWGWLKDSVSIPWGMALIQTAVIVILLLPGTPQNTYKTLSLSPDPEAGNTGASFNVVFKGSTQESEIRELLLSISGTIISGPSAQGRYVISLPPDKVVDQIVEILKQSEFIIFIEKTF